MKIGWFVVLALMANVAMAEPSFTVSHRVDGVANGQLLHTWGITPQKGLWPEVYLQARPLLDDLEIGKSAPVYDDGRLKLLAGAYWSWWTKTGNQFVEPWIGLQYRNGKVQANGDLAYYVPTSNGVVGKPQMLLVNDVGIRYAVSQRLSVGLSGYMLALSNTWYPNDDAFVWGPSFQWSAGGQKITGRYAPFGGSNAAKFALQTEIGF